MGVVLLLSCLDQVLNLEFRKVLGEAFPVAVLDLQGGLDGVLQ